MLHIYSEPEATLTKRADVPAGWYIQIDRQYSPASLAVGPYKSELEADAAFTSSLLIDGFCEEDCLDAGVTYSEGLADEVDLVVIDADDPNHHGRD